MRTDPLPPRIRSLLLPFLFLAAGVLLGAFVFHGNPHDHGGATSSSGDSAKTIWTCSMHPQIRRNKPGKCPICSMDLIPLTKSTKSKLRPRELQLTPEARDLAKITSVPVKRQWVDAEIEMVGKVDYDETRTKTIAAWFPARIDKLYVDYTGVDVREGDHLAFVYSPELLTAQRELISAIKFGSGDVGTIKEKLRLWGLSEDKIKSIEQRGKIDDHMDIDAPFGGIVTQKEVNQGDYIKTGDTLFKIADLSKVWVILDAYESDLPWLRYGQKVEFKAEAVPGKTFEGMVTFISPILDPTTRTIKVRVNAGNSDFSLKPEMFVHATSFARLAAEGKVIAPNMAGKWIGPMHPEIILDHPGKCPICGMNLARAKDLGYSVLKQSEKAPLIVPTSAVLLTGKRSVVYVELPDTKQPSYEGREITVGPKAGDFYIVDEGLKEGEKVVTEGNFKIDSALQISAKPSMMNPVNTGNKDENSPANKGVVVYSVPDEFKNQLSALFPAYFRLQSSLAADDEKGARQAASEVTGFLGRVDMKLVKDEAHHNWMSQLASLKNETEKIVGATNLKEMRTNLQPLSDTMLKTAEVYALPFDQPVLLFHCPMAFDGKGGDWLQQGKETHNPYFGKAMQTCGEVKKRVGSKPETKTE